MKPFVFFLYASISLVPRVWVPVKGLNPSSKPALLKGHRQHCRRLQNTSLPHSSSGDKGSKSKGYLSRSPECQYGIWSSHMSLFFWFLTNGAASNPVNWTSFSSSGSHCGLDIYMEGNIHHFQVQAVEQVIVCANKMGRVWCDLWRRTYSSLACSLVLWEHTFELNCSSYTGTVLLPVFLMTAL